MFFSTKHFIQLLDKLFLHCPSKNTTKIMPQNCGQKELSFNRWLVDMIKAHSIFSKIDFTYFINVSHCRFVGLLR